MRKKIYFVILCLSLCLSGCAEGKIQKDEQSITYQKKKEKETVELSVLYSNTDVSFVTAVEEMCENFMKENPDIHLLVEGAGKGSYTETLKTKIALDEFPDVMEIQDPIMFAQAGKLGEIPRDVAQLVETPWVWEKKNYTIPFYYTTYGMIYNQLVFEKYHLSVPKTYEDFLEICKILKYKGVMPLALGGSKENVTDAWQNYFFQKDVISQDALWLERLFRQEASFEEDAVLQMLEEFRELMTSDYVLENSVNMSENQVVSKLVSGEVAMYYTEPDIISRILDAYPQTAEPYEQEEIEQNNSREALFRIGWFFLPDEEGNYTAVEKTGMQWAISKKCLMDTKKSEAVKDFLRFCYRRDNYRKVLQTMYAIPSSSEAVLYPSVSVQRGLLVDYRYADKSRVYFGNAITPVNLKARMNNILYSVAANTINVDKAVEQLEECYTKVTEDNSTGKGEKAYDNSENN